MRAAQKIACSIKCDLSCRTDTGDQKVTAISGGQIDLAAGSRGHSRGGDIVILPDINTPVLGLRCHGIHGSLNLRAGSPYPGFGSQHQILCRNQRRVVGNGTGGADFRLRRGGHRAQGHIPAGVFKIDIVRPSGGKETVSAVEVKSTPRES